MNNMYEILGKMNLLEGKGNKPDFLDLDKDGNRKEKMKDAAKEVDEAVRIMGKPEGSQHKLGAYYHRNTPAGQSPEGQAHRKATADMAKAARAAGSKLPMNRTTDPTGKRVPSGYDAGATGVTPFRSTTEEGSTGDYSAKKARAGKDIGKPGKAFATIAAKAGKAYGSKERGEKVAGAVLAKLRKGAHEGIEQEGNAFTGKLKSTPKGGTFKLGDKEFKDTSNLEELDLNLLKAAQKHSKSHTTQRDPESDRNIHKKYGYRSDRDDSGNDDDYDEWGNEKKGKKKSDKSDGPKKKGRPKGTGRKLGAKGPTGKSKLMKMKEGLPPGATPDDAGEYGNEGDMAKDDIHTIVRHAKALERILGDQENLPEWVQSKLAKIQGMMVAVDDYMQTQHERDSEMATGEEELDEKAVSKAQQRFMGMAHAMQKGEKVPGASKELKKVAKTMKKGDVEDFAKTKHKGLPEKKKKEEEVDETTVAGSVATAPAEGKGKKGMVFGKGVYEGKIEESYSQKLTQVLNEGMSINMSVGEDGQKSLNVNATDEDAIQLAQILKMAGVGSSSGYHESCPACGQQECGCEQMEEDYSNSPEPETQSTNYMTKTIAGGLNKNKVTGMTTIPVVPTQAVTESEMESNLMNLYKQFKA